MTFEYPARAHFIELQRKLLDYQGVTATSRYVELQDPPIKAHVLDAGKGEPLVILHGGDGEAVNWAPLMAILQLRVHMYAVDRPGFGLSDAFDYRRVDQRTYAASFVCSLLDALGLETATVAGGSMGGFFALATALGLPRPLIPPFRYQRAVVHLRPNATYRILTYDDPSDEEGFKLALGLTYWKRLRKL